MTYADMEVDVVTLPTYSFVTILEMKGDPAEGTLETRSPEPDEKANFDDLCGAAVIADVGGDAPGDELRIGLRFRPGVDLAERYPNTFSSEDLQASLATEYMSVPLDLPSPVAASGIVRAFMKRHGNAAQFDTSAIAFWTQGVFFVPLLSNNSGS